MACGGWVGGWGRGAARVRLGHLREGRAARKGPPTGNSGGAYTGVLPGGTPPEHSMECIPHGFGGVGGWRPLSQESKRSKNGPSAAARKSGSNPRATPTPRQAGWTGQWPLHQAKQCPYYLVLGVAAAAHRSRRGAAAPALSRVAMRGSRAGTCDDPCIWQHYDADPRVSDSRGLRTARGCDARLLSLWARHRCVHKACQRVQQIIYWRLIMLLQAQTRFAWSPG